MKKIIAILLLLAGTAQAQILTTKHVSVTPVVDTNIYAAKDALSPIMAFTGLTCGKKSAYGRITGVTLTDDSDNAVEYDLILFKSVPATAFVANAAFDPSDADLLLMLPVINLASSDHFSFTDNGISSLASLGSYTYALATGGGSATIYGAIVQRGTPTYSATDDVTVTLYYTCD